MKACLRASDGILVTGITYSDHHYHHTLTIHNYQSTHTIHTLTCTVFLQRFTSLNILVLMASLNKITKTYTGTWNDTTIFVRRPLSKLSGNHKIVKLNSAERVPEPLNIPPSATCPQNIVA